MALSSVPVGVSRMEEDQATFLDRLRNRLEEGFNHPNETIELTEGEITNVCEIVKDIFDQEPLLLRVQSPIYVLGDVHGQFYDLLRIFRQIGDTENSFLFLGDYVDRGRQSVELITYLFVLKALHPKKYILLRGNHEDKDVCSHYGFYQEVKRKIVDYTCYFDVIDAFNRMPISALIDERVFCVHGGICRDLISQRYNSFEEFFAPIQRPLEVFNSNTVKGLLWADPIPDKKAKYNELFVYKPRRGCEAFGPGATESFFNLFSLDKMLRGHEFCEGGFKADHEDKCWTVFSAPNYCGKHNVALYLLRLNPANHDSPYQFHNIAPVES